MRLDRESIEKVARRVVELLWDEAMESRQQGKLVDAATVARLLGVSRATVYAKADELGAVRLGNGKRARLRFDPNRLPVAAATKDPSTDTQPRPIRRRARRTRDAAMELLPIHRPFSPGANGRRSGP